MGPTPAKVGRVNAGLLWNSSHRSGLIPDPLEKGCIERDVNAKMDLGSVIIDCGNKHYNRVSA